MKELQKLFFLVCFMLLSVGSSHSNVITGEAAPDFTLTDTSGVVRSLSDFKDKYVVLEWFNYDCPFVRKHYDGGNMQSLQKKFTEQGVMWVSIVSSADGKQGSYSDAKLNELAKTKNVHSSTILADRLGDVGRLYGAKTTPHIFVVAPNGVLIYQGAIDSIAGFDLNEIENAENYVNTTLTRVLNGKSVENSTTNSYGCSIKY